MKQCINCNWHKLRKREPISWCNKKKKEVGIGDSACEKYEEKESDK